MGLKLAAKSNALREVLGPLKDREELDRVDEFMPNRTAPSSHHAHGDSSPESDEPAVEDDSDSSSDADVLLTMPKKDKPKGSTAAQKAASQGNPKAVAKEEDIAIAI